MNYLNYRYLHILLLLSLSFFELNAQEDSSIEPCAYQSNLERLELANPGIINQINQHKNTILQNLQNNDNFQEGIAQSILYTIPVVVHIVWNDPSEDISDAQIYSQIDVLNEDFRALNADISDVDAMFVPDIADVEFEFCLTVIDPNGNPTTGITRTQTTTTEFSGGYGSDVMDPADGGVAPWDTDQFLNIYVCDLGYFLLGYATPPGGPANSDGVVVNYNVFGKGPYTLQASYDLGRTATHEIGHYFGLEHPWGAFGGCTDDDGIADTPTTDNAYYGCPNFGPMSTTCGDQDNFYLFMDYCDDECLLMFSEGQKSVMVSTLTTQRSGLLNSIAACDTGIVINPPPPPVLPNVNVALSSNESNFVICDNQLSPIVTVENIGNTDVTSFEFVYNFNGSSNFTQFWTGLLTPNSSIDINLFDIPVSSDIILNVEVQSTNNNAETDLSDNAITLDYTISVTGTFPLIEKFEDDDFEQGGWITEDDFTLTTTAWVKNPNIGAQNSDACFMIDNQLLSTGSVNYLTTPYLDLFGKTNISLKFDYAYAKLTGNNADNFLVEYSVDCGTTWNDLHNFPESELTTAPETSSTFIPGFSDWREKYISLDFLNNQDKVIFRFTNISSQGSRFYIDNINFNYLNEIPANLIEVNNNLAFNIYPNPIKDGFLNIVSNNFTSLSQYEIFSPDGKMLKHGTLNQFNMINLSNVNRGFIFVKIISEDNIFVEKIFVND